MKKLEIIIKPERLEELKTILEACGASGIMVNNLMGYGNQKGFVAQYRGTQYMVNLLPKISVTTVTQDDKAEIMIGRICQQLSKGAVGDGKIFVYDVADAIRIRTGERGEKAL